MLPARAALEDCSLLAVPCAELKQRRSLLYRRAPPSNTPCVHSHPLCPLHPLRRSAAAVCAAVNGPLANAGTTVTCGTKKPSGFTPAPKKGRYVVVELSSTVKGAKSQLAAAEVVIFGRRELHGRRVWGTVA